VHTTEKVLDNLNPKWKKFTITVSSLCNGDLIRPIKIELFDWESDGDHKYIGGFESNFE